MAKNNRSKKSEAELKNEIALSRSVVARELRGLSYEADIPAKIGRSFRSQTAIWIAGAVVLGVVVTLMPRKKKVVVETKSGDKSKDKLIGTGLALGILKIAANLAKPAIMKFVHQRMTGASTPPPRRSW